MKRFKCAACGQGQVVMLAKPGRRAAFKNIPDLEVPETLELPTCELCGAEWLDERAAAQLDIALADVYRRELSRKANYALRQLKAAKLRQWDLEPLLGLSPGYLSKVKAGKDISPMLASALLLLAGAPGRVSELREALRSAPREERTDSKVAAQSRAHMELPKGSRNIQGRVFGEEFVGELQAAGIVQATRLKLTREHRPPKTSAIDYLWFEKVAA